MNWNTLAIISQLLSTAWFALTHWISLPPLNNLSEEAFPHERQTNLILNAFQIASMVGFLFQLHWLMWIGVIFWSISLIGHLLSWWLPYFFGWPKAFLQNAEQDNVKTYHFLPVHKNHPVPDLNHCIIGVLLFFTLFFSWITLIN